MNLLIITHDFPYGTAETFLETEIQYACASFEKVFVLSMSQNENLTRTVPDNVVIIKASRRYKLLRCVFYALFHVLTIESVKEIVNASKRFSLKKAIKDCLKTLAIEHRLFLKTKEEKLYGLNFIAYSYWLAEGAYFIAKHKKLWLHAVSRAHSYELWSNRNQPFLKDTIKKLDKIYPISLATERLLEEKTDCKHSCLARLGIEDNRIQNDEKLRDIFTIVSCSSIYPLKRVDLIIDILSRISEKNNISIQWIHLGGGKDETTMRQLCEEKLRGVKWRITGWIQNGDVIDFYKTTYVDLFINMSDMEGIPVSIMEAISFGIPCIARDVGGNSEIVNAITGSLVPQNCTAAEVAAVIDSYIAGNTVKDRKAIVEFFSQTYSADTNYQMFYSDILDI